MKQLSIVLLVTFIVLVLVYYGYQFYKWKEERENLQWPPEITECPDYWLSVGKHKCKNVYNLGKCPTKHGEQELQGEFDFRSHLNISSNDTAELNKLMYTTDALKKKCKWAKSCDASWEGVDDLCY